MTPRICPVPRCGGRLIEKEVRGQLLTWCVACERRIEQLKALQAKVLAGDQPMRQEVSPAASSPAPTGAEISDEALIAIVRDRLIPITKSKTIVKRALNRVVEAQRAGKIASIQVGTRMILIGRRSLEAWSATVVTGYRGRPLPKWTDAIPRSPKKPLVVEALAKAGAVKVECVKHWISEHRDDRRLKRVPVEHNGRATFAYWWHETPEPATEVQHA